MTRRNWAEIRERYITSVISLRDLAREAHVPFGSLHKVAKREDWQQARRAVGDRRMTLVTEAAAKLNLPERSARLREKVVTELEVDANLVAASPPATLDDAEQRQSVVSAITRNAAIALEWGEGKPTPAVRIAVLASCFYLNEEGMAVYSDGIRPPPIPADEIRRLPISPTIPV